MVDPAPDAPPQVCPACGTSVAIGDAEPLELVACPNCGERVRVQRLFDHFEIVETLGAGGMGAVYKARDTRLERFVALKLLRRELSADPLEAARLQQEARVTAAVNHPNVVQVYSTGTDHGQIYLVMELVDHGSLDDLMAQHGKLREPDVLRTGIQVAKGLQAAQAKGLIHRDVKPANILFADAETAKIGDFGLAVRSGQQSEAQNEIWGTPYYVAPERLNNEPEDFRSDIFSLGATLFHALAARPPLDGETTSAAELRMLKSHPPDLRSFTPGVSKETARIINKMLQPKPENRFTSYAHLISQMERAARVLPLTADAPRTRSPSLIAAIALAVVAVAGGAFYFYRDRAPAEQPNELTEATATPPDAAALQRRYDAARQQLAQGKFDAAATALTRLTTEASGLQPLLNWIRLHAGLAAMLQGRQSPARDLFQQVERDAAFSKAKGDAELVKFFAETSRLLAAPGAIPSATVADANPFALLLYGLKNWQAREFEDAAALLQQYVDSNPSGAIAWATDYKPLGRKFLDDYRAYVSWTSADKSDLRRAVDAGRAVQKQLQLKGALAEEVETQVRRLAVELDRRESAERQRLLAIEQPAWEAALAEARRKIAAYDFRGAVTTLNNTRVSESTLQEARAAELKKAEWLAAWKARLIGDLKTGALQGEITVGPTTYNGASDANENEILFRIVPYGTARLKWQQIPPKTLLAMSNGFIRAASPDAADRQWLAAVFAQATDQPEAARTLAESAAKAKPEYQQELRTLLP